MPCSAYQAHHYKLSYAIICNASERNSVRSKAVFIVIGPAELIIIVSFITHADDNRGRKAFIAVCLCVCDCVSVSSITQKQMIPKCSNLV